MPHSTFRDEDSLTDPSVAWRAFYNGNYAKAFADAFGLDTTLENLAAIMCGAVERGLEGLADTAVEMPVLGLYRAYGFWCLDQTSEAINCLAGLNETPLHDIAKQLTTAITGPPIDLLLAHMPNSDKFAGYEHVEGFRVTAISMEPEAFESDMADVIAAQFSGVRPQMAVSLDAYGPYLPKGFYDAGIPTVLWASDHDYFIASRYTDLAAATLVIVNAAEEHAEIGSIYEGRVASFPGHEIYRGAVAPDGARREKRQDVMFTGRAFVPYMADKARFLASVANSEERGNTIIIVDDYLSEDAYLEALSTTRFVPVFWRYTGGLQTRAIEALRQGAEIVSAEPPALSGLINGLDQRIHGVDEARLPATLGALISTSSETGWLAAPEELFWSSPEREARFLKFCYFQTVLAPQRGLAPKGVRAVPVELRGYDTDRGLAVYSTIARANLADPEKSPAHFNNAAIAAFYAAILVSDNQELGIMALDGFSIGHRRYPRHLVLAFNQARALWVFGRRTEAETVFNEIADNADEWSFDPRCDALLSHRTRVLAEMFCYGEYYRAVARCLVEGDVSFSVPRAYVKAGAYTYLADAAVEAGEEISAERHLLSAIDNAVDAFPAWQRLAQLRSKSKGSPVKTHAAFSKAVELYPPLLINLMPIGVAALVAMDREDEALSLVGRWLRLAFRTYGTDGLPKPIPAEALAIAERYRNGLGTWADALDDLRATTKSREE